MIAADFVGGLVAALRKQVVHIVEPTKGPWVNQNLWGDQRTQPLPTQTGQVVEVLPKNNRLYGPPAVHSVQLSRGDEAIAQNADMRARVTYGCGGIENTFECDWMHGVQFCLVCNTVNVKAVSYQPSLLVAYNAAAASIFLGAMVAKGTVSRGAALTFTEQTRRLAALAGAPANAVTYSFPDFAREVTVHGDLNSNPATAQNVTLVFLNQGSGVIAEYDLQVCAGGRRVPIPAGANQMLVVNNTAGTYLITAQWFLGL